MYIPVIVSSRVSIHIKYKVEVISLYFTVHWLLVAEEKVSVDADRNGYRTLFGELSQIIQQFD